MFCSYHKSQAYYNLCNPNQKMKIIHSGSIVCVLERAAKVAEQQERERAAQQLNSPRAGTPVEAHMRVVSPPSPMGMLNHSMTFMAGNPSPLCWWKSLH